MEGLEGLRVGNADALEIRIAYYGNVICSAPWLQHERSIIGLKRLLDSTLINLRRGWPFFLLKGWPFLFYGIVDPYEARFVLAYCEGS